MGKRKESTREKNSYLFTRFSYLLKEIKALAIELNSLLKEGKVESEDDTCFIENMSHFLNQNKDKSLVDLAFPGKSIEDRLEILKSSLESIYRIGKDLYKKYMGKEWEEKE